MNPRRTLEAFDRFLVERQLGLEAVVIGGTALNLLGVIDRATRDCDILHPSLPTEVVAASVAFAVAVRRAGGVLAEDWLNNGPSSLTKHLMGGWDVRLQSVFAGRAITLRSLGRLDFLCAKLWALCDRGIDLGDCIALAPTVSELAEVLPWLEQQDANPDWPTHVLESLTDLGRRLGHGV